MEKFILFFKVIFTLAFFVFACFLQENWTELETDQKAFLFFCLFISLYGLFLLFMFNFKTPTL